MTDLFDAATQSRVMRAIPSRNTAPEMIVRRALRAADFGYRVAPKSLPGRPDIVWSPGCVAIFVHGRFW